MTKIDQDLIDDAKASGLYLALDVAWIVLGKHIEPLAKFAQLQRERQAQPTPSQSEPVAKVYSHDGTGGYDIEYYKNLPIPCLLYTKPQPTQPQTVKDALEQVLKILHDDSNLSTSAWVEKYGVLENGSLDAIRALIQTEKGEL